MKLLEKVDWATIATMAVIALLFASGSIAIPSMFHYAQPAEHYYDVQQVEVTVDEQDPCTLHWRTVSWARHETDIQVHAILYLHDEDERRVIEEWNYEAEVPDGVTNIHRERHVDEPLDAGVYQVEYEVAFNTPYGWEKQVEQTSHKFGIHHGETDVESVFPEAGHVAVYPSSARCQTGE